MLPRLRPLRTYYLLSGDTELAYHYFYRVYKLANYTHPGEISVVDVRDAQSAGERNIRPATPQFDNPPPRSDTAELIAPVLVNRLADLNSRAKIELRYDGYYQEYQLVEVIAFDPEGRERRTGRVTQARVRVWPDGRLILNPVNLYQRGELHHSVQNLGEFVQVIDYALPSEIDGSSLLALGDQGLIPTTKHAEAYQNLLNMLRRPPLFKGSFDAQLDRIEAQAGLRAPAQQHIALNLTVLGYLGDQRAAIRGQAQMLIATDHLVAGAIDQTLSYPALGYALRLRGSLRAGFVISARDLETDFVVEREFMLGLDTPAEIDPQTGRATLMTDPRFITHPSSFKLHGRKPFQMLDFTVAGISSSLATGLKCADQLEAAISVDSPSRVP